MQAIEAIEKPTSCRQKRGESAARTALSSLRSPGLRSRSLGHPVSIAFAECGIKNRFRDLWSLEGLTKKQRKIVAFLAQKKTDDLLAFS
jgi:hypothetical protein